MAITTTTGPPEPTPVEQNEEDGSAQIEDSESEDDGENNVNMIIAQYRTENRVKSTFKFNLQNVVMFIDGQHYYVKELKAAIQF